jgi:hypothetical protein|tara:strand:- start:690 stop:908 length:219 start_codon:yes stop_codon:yes gene_type:complete
VPSLTASHPESLRGSDVVSLYLATTCSGSISSRTYQALIGLEKSADQIEQKLIQHLKNRVMQGSILLREASS